MLPITLAVLLLHLPSAAWPAAVRADPPPTEAGRDFAQGVALYQKGDYKGAVRAEDEAIRLKADFAAAYVDRGIAHEALREDKYARADYDTSLRINPRFGFAYYNRALLRSAHKDDKGAKGDFALALQFDPGLPIQLLRVAGNLLMQGNAAAAIHRCTDILQINPSYAEAYAYRSTAENNRQNYGAAIADADEALKLNPRIPLAYNSLAMAHFRRGEFKLALQDINQAITLAPKTAVHYLNRSNIYLNLRDAKDALADCDTVLALQPRSARAYFWRGCVYWAAGSRSRSSEDFHQAMQIDPAEAGEIHAFLSPARPVAVSQDIPSKTRSKHSSSNDHDTSYYDEQNRQLLETERLNDQAQESFSEIGTANEQQQQQEQSQEYSAGLEQQYSAEP